MNAGENPLDEDRREPDHDLNQHVAQVWAAPIADLDVAGLFRLGTACLDVAETTAYSERCTLLSGVAFALLVYAGGKDKEIGGHIARLCDRELVRADIKWKTAGGKINNTHVVWSNYDATTNGFDLPGTGGTSTVTGSYAGEDAVAHAAITPQALASLANKCDGKGIKNIKFNPSSTFDLS